MKGDNRIALLWLILACMIIGLALGAGIARADTPHPDTGAAEHGADICMALDSTPGVEGMLWTMQNYQDIYHVSDESAARTVMNSILHVCPIHAPTLYHGLEMFGDR